MIRLATAFSGVGAPEEAMRKTGLEYTTEFAIEVDKYARRTFLENHEVTHMYEDILTRPQNPSDHPIDILVAGPPCQPFSTAGKRRGLDDPRGRMLSEFVRLLSDTDARSFLFENVPGLVSIGGGKTWREMLTCFAMMGYSTHWKILNTADFGIPQNRRRVFAVGFKGEGLAASLFTFPDPFKLSTTVGDYLEDYVEGRYILTDKGRDFVLDPEKQRKKYTQVDGTIAITQTARQMTSWHGDFVTCRLVDEKYVLRDGPTKTALRQNQRNFRGIRIDPRIARTLVASQYIKAVNAGDVNYVTDPRRLIRKLTPRECFRLQGFPDTFKLPVSDAQLYKQAGNSMSVNVVRAIISRMATRLEMA